VKRRFGKRQRQVLAWIAGGHCQLCGTSLTKSFHADHVVPYSRGGPTFTKNGQALCASCNLNKGSKTVEIKLRAWQQEALDKALSWLVTERQDRHFLINAAPGAGKTLAACAITQVLFERDEIDRVIVIAPRAEVVNQWSADFQRVTGRYMSKVTGSDGDINQLGVDVCATWSAVQGLEDALQAVCQSSRVLVICDEHHHAAVKATWGSSADGAFSDARFALILTGTPIRSDGAESVWLAYDNVGAINHPEAGTYTLTYGEAVDLEYCRPVTFHRHEGKFTVDLDGGEEIQVSSQKPAELTPELARVSGLQTALSFYHLACTPQYDVSGKAPLVTGYQATMLEWGSNKLDELRLRMPEAGGLVIAPTIEMAEYMAELIESIEGEAPLVVHSQQGNAEGKIKAFRNTDKRWIVSVAMISEGVDIKRLRVLVYLPNALTELSFRQAIGRVVRTVGYNDDTRAYVVMPSFDTFGVYARRVEQEMSPSSKLIGLKPHTKKCPVCSSECDLAAKTCDVCEHEFPKTSDQRFKPCADCGALNPHSASSCNTCGKSFGTSFTLSLDEALRTGAIIRGMDLDEAEVQNGEKIAKEVRNRVLRSGDETLVRIINTLPEESFGRLRDILESTSGHNG
jgi:superfamily II DNA or RNA helicase